MKRRPWKVIWVIVAVGLLVLCVVYWKHIAHFVFKKWEDLVVNTVGTLLGFALAYLLYLIQTAATTRADERKAAEAAHKERVATMERYAGRMRWLSDTLKEVIDFANGQAEQLELLVGRMLQDPYSPQQLAFITSFSTERLAKPDVDTTFHAYNAIFSQDPNKGSNYRRLLRITDNLTDAITHKKETFLRYLDAVYSRQLQLKELIQRSANELSTLNMSMEPEGTNKKLANSELREFVNGMLLHYNQNLLARRASLNDILQGYVHPLKKPLLAHRHVPGVQQLLTTLKDATVLFDDIRAESDSFISAFSPSGLREPATALEVIQASLEVSITCYEASIQGASTSVS